jgi:hypothetical protein
MLMNNLPNTCGQATNKCRRPGKPHPIALDRESLNNFYVSMWFLKIPLYKNSSRSRRFFLVGRPVLLMRLPVLKLKDDFCASISSGGVLSV